MAINNMRVITMSKPNDTSGHGRLDGVKYELVAPETNPSNEDVEEFAQSLFDTDPYYSFIGLTVERVADNEAVLSVPNAESELLTPNPPALESLHGGVMTTLVDISSATAILTIDTHFHGYATASLDVEFVKPARGRVEAQAEVTRTSENLVSTEVSAVDADGAEVAAGETTWRVFRNEEMWNYVTAS